ncbi:MAG: hypothetical protein ACLU5J_08495 [Christensenellales bacterium]
MSLLRIGAVSSGKFIWKAGVLQVLGEVDTPEALVGYFEKTKIEGLFDNEYADSAVIEYEVLEGSNIVLSHSSSDAVTASTRRKFISDSYCNSNSNRRCFNQSSLNVWQY